MAEINYVMNPAFGIYDKHEPANLALTRLVDKKIINQVVKFHQSIPNYSPTPLVPLKSLSEQLGVNSILVKDESKRFELNAFKMLGASYAITSIDSQNLTFQTLVENRAKFQNLTFATATDGNHGRAVAWCCKLFGCKSQVFMPKNSSPARLDAIKNYTTNTQITEFNYDETVKYVEKLATTNDWVLMQDTAWKNYTEIPSNIMRGYFSLMAEFEIQSANIWPSHVFLQAGVGSMAAAVAAYFYFHEKPTPKIVVVEPSHAPCFYDSIIKNDGKPHNSGDLNTIMAGLACGMPSITAWEILRKICTAFIVCDDSISLQGMKRYARPIGHDTKITSGESGAVSLGLLEAILQSEKYCEVRENLALAQQANVLLLSTEGDTDPEFYSKVLSN